MPETSSDPKDGSDTMKRNLPSWIGSKGKGNKGGRKMVDTSEGVVNHVNESGEKRSTGASQHNFSKLLEDVVFVLSGFVNPERSTLRSHSIEMGAEYRPDWTSDCTLLVCAFTNTPKFRQVASDGGTIVSKEWISECYNQKKLVEIEPYLMHAGKPWRKSSRQLGSNQDQKNIQSGESQKQGGKRVDRKPTGSTVSKGKFPDPIKDKFSPSKVKQWAKEDLSKTMSWLESQEEKPEPKELKTIAAEGIITCLQDAIESLRDNHDVGLVMEQWMFVPCVVKELAGLEGGEKTGLLSKKDICELAVKCKNIYQSEFEQLHGSSPGKGKKRKTDCGEAEGGGRKISDDAGYDSDQTIEMIEEEIGLASKISDDAGYDSDQTIEMTEEEIGLASKNLSS